MIALELKEKTSKQNQMLAGKSCEFKFDNLTLNILRRDPWS